MLPTVPSYPALLHASRALQLFTTYGILAYAQAFVPEQLPSLQICPVKLLQASVPTQQLPEQAVLHRVDVPRTLPLKQSRKPAVHVGAMAEEMVMTLPASSSAPVENKIPASTLASEDASAAAVVTLTKDEESDGALSALP